ncbi:peroxiredoxin-like 2C [Hippocampus zosterae]|uniref:peroxiredoxin-like 2C n=1 Tax=Hippocampus zosterae TaxID=109293 RepID=UPI00223D6CEC|nr:peroxiredoxin-like 2C [Hippocampus zosterae]
MAELKLPVTRQIESGIILESESPQVNVDLRDVDDCFIYDRHGTAIPFKSLYQERKSIIIFVRNFLCYSCKDYVDDLSKIPKEVLEDANVSLIVIGQSAHLHIQPFCSLTGYAHEIYVDPERLIYHKLGMKREEKFTVSAQPSPHVKSGILMGQMRSIWRAMTSPVFDFQGDLHQQGGAIIAGPGSQVHFCHFDMNHLDHMPINWLLELAGVQGTLNFSNKPKVIHV